MKLAQRHRKALLLPLAIRCGPLDNGIQHGILFSKFIRCGDIVLSVELVFTRVAYFLLSWSSFLSIAFDASFTHMYAPGTRRHIKAALALGVTIEEIMEVLKICVSQGSVALDS